MTNIYFESVLMAWSSIVSNKMRSLLTMLGIIIGVAAVIALMSIGYGVQDSIKSDISRLGSNTITVTPGTGRKPGVKQAAGSMQTLTYKDYLAIRNLPNITYSAPLVQGSYLLISRCRKAVSGRRRSTMPVPVSLSSGKRSRQGSSEKRIPSGRRSVSMGIHSP